VPITKENEFDVSKQKEIVEKYQCVKELRDLVELEKRKINDLVVDIEEEKFGSSYQIVTIDKIFDLSIKTNSSKLTKSFVNNHQGEIPVYGASKDENATYGKIEDNLPNINLSEKVIPLIFRDTYKKSLDLFYLKYTIEKELAKQNFGFSNKAGKDKIKNIEIKIPITFYKKFDLVKQREIAEKYKQIEEIKKNIKTELEKIENIKVDIELRHPESEYQDLYLLRGKRRKDRYVYVSPEIAAILQSRNWQPNQTNRRDFWEFLRRVRHDLQISPHTELAPHTLRRCFATYNLLAGMPLNILQKVLGH
ncbi:31974_t:CDS:2, partial [Racocetra persica]